MRGVKYRAGIPGVFTVLLGVVFTPVFAVGRGTRRRTPAGWPVSRR